MNLEGHNEGNEIEKGDVDAYISTAIEELKKEQEPYKLILKRQLEKLKEELTEYPRVKALLDKHFEEVRKLTKLRINSKEPSVTKDPVIAAKEVQNLSMTPNPERAYRIDRELLQASQTLELMTINVSLNTPFENHPIQGTDHITGRGWHPLRENGVIHTNFGGKGIAFPEGVYNILLVHALKDLKPNNSE